jgi:putative chitinase
MNINRENFWNSYRQAFGKVNQKTVDAIEFLLAQFETVKLSRPQTAYLLATIKHETSNTFLPIYEKGSKSYFNKYNGRIDLGNTKAGDGYRYRGRGFVQLTGRTNYERYGIDATPDSALEPGTAFHILVDGTTKGVFTGVRLDKHINSSKTDYTNARRVVNGTDKASLIAGYARTFERILKDSAAAKSDNQETLSITTPSIPLETAVPSPPIEQAAVVAVPALSAAPTDTPPQDEGTLTKIGNKLNAAYTAVGATIAGIIAWFSSMPGAVVLYIMAAVVVLGVTYMILRELRANAKDKRDREDKRQAEQREFELKKIREEHAKEFQLYSMRSVAEKDLTAVTICSPPSVEMPNSDTAQ